MGFIWNIILSFDNEEFWRDDEDEPREECEALANINAWMPYGQLVSLVRHTYDDDAGYGMDANIFGGGFKHFDIQRFIKVVAAQKWREPLMVQLWIRGAEEGVGNEPFVPVKLPRPKPAASKSQAIVARLAAPAKPAPTKKARVAARKAAASRKSKRR